MKSLLLLSIFLFAACSSRPQLYPNKKLKRVGKEKANKDINMCMADAEKYLESSKGKQVAKGAGSGAAAGAIVGGIFGLLTGDIKGSVASGAVVGGASGAASGAVSPDQVRQNYTNICLGKKGYQVIGWD